MTDPAPWRDSARPIRAGPLDARLALLIFAWLFHPAPWTSALVLAATAALWLADRRGHRPEAALRALRALSAGRRRALHPHRAGRFADFR